MTNELIEKIELNSIPFKYKKWETLQEYRIKVSFLPYQMREKVAEQLMACDYMLRIELWLKPISVIDKMHKRIYVQQIASVYEGIMDTFLDAEISKLQKENLLIKEITNKKFTEYRSFNKSIDLSNKIKLIDHHWRDYLIKVCEVRNYIHLSKEEKNEIIQWITDNSSQDIRSKLDDFLIYSKERFK